MVTPVTSIRCKGVLILLLVGLISKLLCSIVEINSLPKVNTPLSYEQIFSGKLEAFRTEKENVMSSA
ncbi:hypothetical protein D3C72_1183670 [compost metagenome]